MDLMSNIRFVVGGKVKDVKTEGKVDTNKEGKYTVYYVYGKQKVKAEVEVKDTKAPELKMKDSYTTELPKDIKPEDFVESVKMHQMSHLNLSDRIPGRRRKIRSNCCWQQIVTVIRQKANQH